MRGPRPRERLRRALAVALPFAPWPAHRGAVALALALFFAGSLGAFLFVQSIASARAVALAALVATALYALARARFASRAARVAQRLAALGVTGIYLGFAYEALALGAVLGWSTSGAVRAVVAALALASVLTAARPRWGFASVPAALPLGIWIAACLVGWAREELVIRCDDYRRAVRDPAVRVVVPTALGLERCAEGARIPIGPYPRKVWEAPGGARFVFTTQRALHDELRDGPAPAPGRINGVICEADAAAGYAPRCIGGIGKAHGIVEAPEHDRLFVGVMSGLGPEPARRGGIVALPRQGPLVETGRRVLRHAGNMFYDPARDLLGSFGDEGVAMEPVRASDLAPRGPARDAMLMGPDTIRYDAARGEGVLCSGSGPLRTLEGGAFVAVAFRAEPFALRPLAHSARAPESWAALSWGCDWNQATRTVYAAVPTLGLLEAIDYDSGRVRSRHFVGFGMRSVAFDPARARVYMGNFLGGEVVAVEAGSGRVQARWFVGRFVRNIALARDGRGLVVTSNLGVVRVGF